MTTIDATITEALQGMLARRLARKREGINYARTVAWFSIVRLLLRLAGFSCLTLSAYLWDMRAGIAIAGISCFWLLSLMKSDMQDSQQTMSANRPLRR